MPAAAPSEARAEAVELYRTVGPLEASRRTGYSDFAIRGWAQEAGVRAPRHGHDWSAIEECSDSDAAYLAGIIDGEGCITILRRKHVERGQRPRYALEVVVINTDVRLIEWLQARFGGSVNRRKIECDRWADSFRWRSSNLHSEAILRRVRPFLIIKAAQADLALKFRETFGKHACRFRMPAAATYAERERLRQEIQFLNRRGPKDAQP